VRAVSMTRGLEAVSIPEMRRFLAENGFTPVGKWGAFLERFQLKHGKRVFDVIVPTTRDIADYRQRVADALSDLAAAIELPVSEILQRVLVAEYRTLKVRAHPGSDISSIPFDEAYALLSNSKALIKASAVSAYSRKHKRLIRGRAPIAVDEYMERVQLGQSEVGSYVFTLLLPKDDSEYAADLNTERSAELDTVATTLENGIALAAEFSSSRRVPSMEQLAGIGLSANFCESLYNIVDWAGQVDIELTSAADASLRENKAFSFDRTALSVLERTADKLAPEERKVERTITGTITRLNEPQIRRRGSIDLRIRIDGRQRSVRINFAFDDRDTIINAFREKASRALTVTGYLRTERNGHLILEDPKNFSLSRRGDLL
jgi:hypothetical protein